MYNKTKIKKKQNKYRNFIMKIFSYINNNIFGIHRTIIFELDLEGQKPKIVTDLELTFRLATKKDINEMDKEHFEYDKKAKKYAINRLEKGDRCILALYNGKIIGYLWTMKDTMELTQFKHISLSRNRAFSYKGFCVKKFRGKRVHGAMYDYLINLLKKDGKRFVVSTVGIDNKPALRTKERGGYKIIGKIIHYTFFGFKYNYINKRLLAYLQNNKNKT